MEGVITLELLAKSLLQLQYYSCKPITIVMTMIFPNILTNRDKCSAKSGQA